LAQRYTANATNGRRTLQDVDERIQRLTQPSGIDPAAEFGHDWSIALVVVNAGHHLDSLQTMLGNYSPRYAAIGSKDKADRYLEALHGKAVDYVRKHPAASKNDMSVILATRLDLLERQPWPGPKGLTDIAVLRASRDRHGRGVRDVHRVDQAARPGPQDRRTVPPPALPAGPRPAAHRRARHQRQRLAAHSLSPNAPIRTWDPPTGRGEGSGCIQRQPRDCAVSDDVWRALGHSAWRVWLRSMRTTSSASRTFRRRRG
jgi:hypothetical protein